MQEHTKRLDRIEKRLDNVEKLLEGMKADMEFVKLLLLKREEDGGE